jgi:transcriptional regulator with XRE-family HTH domain
MAALPFCHSEIRSPRPKPTAYPRTINTLGDHIRTRRLDLKLRQKQVADQIGVDEATITNWERNAAVPAVRHMSAIIRSLGCDPLPPTDSFSERPAIARKATAMPDYSRPECKR